MAGWTDWAKLIMDAYGAYSANKGNKDATNASVAGSQAGIDEMRRQFDLSRNDQMPWLDAGKAGLGDLQSLMGGDLSKFNQGPDYTYAMDQMTKQADRSAASRGRLYSGGYGLDYAKAVNGLASSNLGNYRGALQSLAGVGQSAAQNLGSLGTAYAGGISSQYNNMGNARASGYQRNGYNNAAFASNMGGTLADWYNQKGGG